jgi:PAS domain S-box-containing protein
VIAASLALGLFGSLTDPPAQSGEQHSFGPSIEHVSLELFDPSTRSRTTLTDRNGLPTNAITALCYDADGFLMVGTQGGLARYDGTTFESLLAEDHEGLDSDLVLSLFADRRGTAWVGVNHEAPSLYVDGGFRRLCDRSLIHSVRQVVPASDGSLWLVGNVLARVADGEVHPILFDPTRPRSTPRSLVEDQEGRVWVASDAGVYAGDVQGFERVDERPAGEMIADFQGEPWCQSPDGVLFQPLPNPSPPIDLGRHVVFEGGLDLAENQRLLATRQGVLLLEPGHVDGSGLRVRAVQGTLRSATGFYSISQFLRDGEGDLWLGTDYGGLDHLECFSNGFVDLPRPNPLRPINGVHPVEPDRAIVVGHSPEESFVVDREGQATRIERAKGGPYRILGTATNDSGTWIATSRGIAKLEEDRFAFDPSWDSRCRGIVAHPDGSIWAAFESEIKCVMTSTGGATSPALAQAFRFPAGWIRGLRIYQGSIAAFNNEGVFKLDRKAGRWTLIGTLGDVKVRDVREGANGELWVTTYGQGLQRISSTGEVDRWSLRSGLPDRFLSWIGPPDESGYLWINGNSGVVRVNVSSLDDYLDGSLGAVEAVTFPSPEANGATGAVLADGVFLLPTLKGASLFDRSLVPTVLDPPEVVFESPLVDGIPLTQDSNPIGKANVIFKFTAPIFPTATGATFQYRLRDKDEQWQNAGTARSVPFPALGPGTYALEVRAKTPTSLWSTPTTSMPLVVERYWYQHPWAWALGALAAALTVLWFVRIKTSSLKSQNSVLSREVDHRLEVEGELRSSEERFRRLFHTAPSAIVSWSPTGVLIDRNERANALFGWEPADSVDVMPWELFADSKVGRDAFERVLRDHEDIALLAEAKPNRGESRRCRWQFAHSFDAAGKLSLIIALVADLSKQDEATRSLNRLRASLADAEETERSRIARELHDDLSQRLAALAMEAHVVDESLVEDAPARQRQIPSFRSALESITSDVHSLSRRLHPTVVDDLGLIKALRSESLRRGEVRNIAVQLNLHGDVADPPRDIALALFRIAQEALSNATRHSGATGIQVHLAEKGGTLELVVEDNGRGIGGDLLRAGGGVGLNSMRERARLKGGDLVLEARPGGGTRVVASIPSAVAT